MRKEVTKTLKLMLLVCVLCVVICFAVANASGKADEQAEEMFATFKRNNIPEDVYELAKLIQVEAGYNPPDWFAMLIGEVILNRVESWRFPNTILEVIHDDKPVQFENVFKRGWDDIIPDDEYIDLAERLMSGERAIGDKDILFFGRTPETTGSVVTYYDKTTNTMTYFSRG